MPLAVLSLSIVVLAITVIGSASLEHRTAALPLPHCNAEQELNNPCRCCKMGCWYTIAQAAAHELGHMPGQAGEEEALATLQLIRACMMGTCTDVCPIRRSAPFANMPMDMK